MSINTIKIDNLKEKVYHESGDKDMTALEEMCKYTVPELESMRVPESEILTRINHAVGDSVLHVEHGASISELMRILGVSPDLLASPLVQPSIGRMGNRIATEVGNQVNATDNSHDTVRGPVKQVAAQLRANGIVLNLPEEAEVIVKYHRGEREPGEMRDHVVVSRQNGQTVVQGAFQGERAKFFIDPNRIVSTVFASHGSINNPGRELTTTEFSINPETAQVEAIYQTDAMRLENGDSNQYSTIEQHLLSTDGKRQVKRTLDTKSIKFNFNRGWNTWDYESAVMQRNFLRNELKIGEPYLNTRSSLLTYSREAERYDGQLTIIENRGKPNMTQDYQSLTVYNDKGWDNPDMPYFNTNPEDPNYAFRQGK